MEDEEHSTDLQVCLDAGDEEEEEEEEEEDELEGVMETSKDKVAEQKDLDDLSVVCKYLPKDTGTKEEAVTNDSKACESRRNEEMKKEIKVRNGTGKKAKGTKESKVFPCNKCGLVSRSSANLKKHMMTHTGEKPYQCLTCSKAFRQRHHLVDHWRIHSGERPFKCDVCDSRFIQKSSLNLHRKRHLGIKSFSCPQCDYATYQKMHLIVHMRTHTGEKPYQCEKCGQVFSSATRLKFHRMIHTGERRYKCEKCGVPFREKVTLQAHMAVHINVGPFECEECGQEFSRLAGLSLHRKVHVNKDSYLYVYNKEANKCFNSAVKKAVEEISPAKTKPQETEEAQSSKTNRESDLESGCDVPPNNTSEQEDSDAVRPEGQETPVALTMSPLTLSPGLSPEDECSPKSKISLCSSNTDLQHKLKENLALNLEYNFENSTSDVHPDQVREALAQGTVLETHNDNGKGFFIILPPLLKNKDIMLLSDSPQPTATALHIPDSCMPLDDRGSTFEGNISPDILSESVLETHRVPYPSVVEEVQECDMDSVGMEEEIYSEVEEGMINPCETGSVECVLNADCPEVLEPLGRYSETVEEQLHPSGMSVHLWKDNHVNQFAEVTYIIEDGKNEPIVIHSQEENHVAQLEDRPLTVKTRRRKTKGSEHVRKEGESGNDLEAGKCVAVKIKINSKKGKVKKIKSQRDYNCEQCGKACKNSSNYIAHLRTHSGERPYFCDICKMGFKQISHLKSHIRIHTGERPYTCSLCNAAFTQSSRLNAHKRNVHPNGQIEVKKKKKKYVPENRIRNFFCRYCNKTFIGECLKIEHMKLHQPLLPYTCKICGMQFKIKSTMMSHFLKHSDDKHICEFCGIEVPKIEDLHKHKITEHCRNLPDSEMVDMYINVKIGEEKDFVVLNPAMKDGQGFAFLNPTTKEGHSDLTSSEHKSKSHVDSEASLHEVKQEVIHVTDVDGNVKSEIEEVMLVNQEDEVVVHDITHVSPEKEKITIPASSDSNSSVTLQKEMSNSVQYNYYIIKEGKMKENKFITYTDTMGKKVWVCKVCDRSFTQSSNLYCHMRMHTGDKPYKCNVCPRAFRQITHLKDHMRRHTGAKPHACGACGKSFTQRSAVRRHIRVLHGGNAEAKKNPESLMSKEVIDTLSDECDQVSKAEEKNILEGKDAPLKDDEQLYRFSQKENVLHICKVCQKQFTQSSRLLAHMRRCGKCETLVKGFHADRKTCWCGESFLSLSQLLKHQKICSSIDDKTGVENGIREISSGHELGENVWKPKCEKHELKDSEKIKLSITKSSDTFNLADDNLFTCRQCGEVLHGIVSFRTHLQGHGGEVCTVCGEMFRRASALRSHQSMKHGREDRRYKDYCPIRYSSVKEEDPEEEEEDIHEGEVGMYYDKSFSFANAEKNEKEEMASDVKRRTPVKLEKEKSYEPEKKGIPMGNRRGAQQTVIDKVAKNVEGNSELSNSSSENIETREYVCNVCSLAFTRSSKLRHHQAMWCRGQQESQEESTTTTTGSREESITTGSRKPLKENPSSKVNNADRKSESLSNKENADISNPPSTPATVKDSLVHNSDCDTADAASRRCSMEQTGTDLFCNCCDKHFKDTCSYKEHMLSHSAEKPFKCERCLLMFKRKAHLYNHYRRHAREERL